jgi:DNA polymerase I-like protein with 3'-5' exonuclease and polymerase domains
MADETEVLDIDLDNIGEDVLPPEPPKQSAAAAMYNDDDMADPATALEQMGITGLSRVPPLSKPWMKHHDFVLVSTVAEVNAIVDAAIASGKCSLDLETEGFDNRIRYDAEGRPSTVHKIVGFCIAYGDAKQGFYIPIRHCPGDDGPDLNVRPTAEVEAAISRLCHAAQPVIDPSDPDQLSGRKWLQPPQVVLDFWNAKFDQEFLFPVTGIDWWHPDSYHDGYLALYVQFTDDKSLGLKGKSAEKLRDPDGNPYEMIEMKELFLKGMPIKFHKLSPDEIGAKNYACSDGVCTRLLSDHPDVIAKTLSKKEWARTYRVEKQTTQVVRVMERNRMKVDRPKLKALLDDNAKKLGEVRAKIVALAASRGFHDFEPGSPKQLGEFLFEPKGLDIEPKPDKHEKSQQWKTDGDTLEQLVKEMDEPPEVLKWILEYRGCEKMQGTYLEGLYNNPDENDELRFDLKQTGTATGRFTAPGREVEQGFSGIPIHGIPNTSALRTVFVARDGYTMVKADYAGEELRIVTNLSNEPVWINEFLTGSGDLHSITARAFFNKQDITKDERKAGKIANFSLVYGGGPAAIMRATGCDRIEAARRKSNFDRSVPVFAAWVKLQQKNVKKTKGVYTAWGRWIAIPDADIKAGEVTSRGKRVAEGDANAIRAACERHSINYPIQGSGADIMKYAMIFLHKEFWARGWLRGHGDDSIRMLMTVHDEIVFEIRHDRVPEALEIICDKMALPGKIVDPKHSPVWKVPLVVEPLIGLSWGGEYDYGKMTHGELKPYKEERDADGNVIPEKLKSYEIRVGDRIFHRVPPWLEGIMEMGKKAEVTPLPGPEGGTPPEGGQPPAAPETAPAAPEAAPAAPAAPAVPVPAAAPPVAVPEPAKPADGGLVTLRLAVLNRVSLRKVTGVCAEHELSLGPKRVLKLVDPLGNTLIDPSLGIMVDVERFISALKDLNLTDGKRELS